MEVQRIKTEGRQIDPVRNQHRMVIEVDVVPVNGSDVEGRRVIGTGRVEIYADRIDAVLAHVRTESHDLAYRNAQDVAARLTEEWVEANSKALAGKSPEERAKYIHQHCNVRPEQQLGLFGYKHGLPPLSACRVVHPNGNTIDAREWRKLSAEKRAEWLIEPPITPENANVVASTAIADAIARALASNSDRSNKR